MKFNLNANYRNIPFIPGERWVEYDDDYSVSDYGRVLSKKYKPYKLLSTNVNSQNQCVVGMHGKVKAVNRLVAECFIYNNNNFKYVKHKDGNKANNRYTNLAWCERFEIPHKKRKKKVEDADT